MKSEFDGTAAAPRVPAADADGCQGAGAELPGRILRLLDAAGLNHRPVLLSVDTDVSLDGRPGREWLSVTRDHLAVIADPEQLRGDRGVSNGVRRVVAWSDVSEVRSVAGVGGGTLQVRAAGAWLDLLRYSSSMATRFHAVARGLEQAREASGVDGATGSLPDRSIEVDAVAIAGPKRCPSCRLRLEPHAENCPRCLQKGRILSRVAELLRPHWKGAAALCGLTLLGVVAELVPPKLQQYMVDGVLAGGSESSEGSPDFRTALLLVVLALAFSRVVVSLVGVWKGWIATAIGTGITSTLRGEMVTKLQALSLSWYDRHQVGSMVGRVAHDSEAVQGLVHQITGGFLLQIVQLVGVGAMLVWINPKLAAFTLIPVPLVILGSWVFWRHVYPRHYRLWDASSKQMAVLSGMLSGIRVVKAFGQEPRERDRFHAASDHLRQWRRWVEYTNASYAGAMQLVFSLGGLIVWYVGGRDVLGGTMTLGQLIAFLAYLAMFYAPLGALSHFTTWLTSFLSGSKRVLELLDAPVSISDPASPKTWDAPRGRIRFRDVTFGYDRNQPVLRDVSFEVAPGEMVGIVGRSGSGKTTLVNLLARFHDVQEGSVEIDGIDVRDVARADLHRRLGVVFQDSFLFRGTIWKNLSYGRPDATVEQGLAAAKAAGAHDFLCRQPLAYETLLGEHGAGLSGGEKQRLSIARTLLYDPAILVLDEATSNIDAEAEKSIQEALAVLVRGRTTIAIAHRLSTLRNADRILAFDRGRLVEQGTHAELLAADGLYARLVKIQTQVTKQPTIDTLLVEESPTSDGDAVAEAATSPAAPAGSIRWLEPGRDALLFADNDRIDCRCDGAVTTGVFVVRCLPATRPEEYLSVRGWNESGEEIEIGMIRSIAAFDDGTRAAAVAAIARRSLVRTITRIHSMELSHGYLDCDVETDVGRRRFTLRWTQSQAVDYGPEGKLLIDGDDDRYVIPRIDGLPPADRERFLRHIYW